MPDLVKHLHMISTPSQLLEDCTQWYAQQGAGSMRV